MNDLKLKRMDIIQVCRMEVIREHGLQEVAYEHRCLDVVKLWHPLEIGSKAPFRFQVVEL
jgi:hypothetical protein